MHGMAQTRAQSIGLALRFGPLERRLFEHHHRLISLGFGMFTPLLQLFTPLLQLGHLVLQIAETAVELCTHARCLLVAHRLSVRLRFGRRESGR